jgi:AcrR family transcriptional regulator
MIRPLDPEKRAAFLTVALQLFVTQGVHNTSTAQIAREAGTAAGTLFLYFPTKEDLINSLLLELVEAQSTSVNSRLSPSMTARESFAAIWHGTIHWLQANPQAYLYIIQVRDSGIVSEEVIEQSALSFGFYYTAIDKGLQEKALKPYPINLIGDILYQDIVAVMNVILRMGKDADAEEISHMGFEIFWDGIKV